MRNTDPADKHEPLGPPIRKAPTPKPEWVPTGNGSIQRNTRDGTMRNVPAPPPAQALRPRTIGDYDMVDRDLGYHPPERSREMRDLPCYRAEPQITCSFTLRDLEELRVIALHAPNLYRVGGYSYIAGDVIAPKADHD